MRVSITIPCRNEKKYIGKCLQSIVDCNYDKSLLNVYVCDGLSDDGTQEIIQTFATHHPFIHLINNLQKTTPQALNLGIKADDSDLKIILGAHAEIDNAYVSNAVALLHNIPDVDCVGGIIENVMEDEVSEVISLAMSSSFGVGNAHFRTGNKDGYVDTVAFGAYKDSVFKTVGYFDEDLVRNQDDEFNFRLINNGLKIYLSKDIRSKYFVRASFQKLFKQYFQYGYWKVYVNKKHKTVTTMRQLVPAAFVLFNIVSIISGLFYSPLFTAYAAVISLYFTGAIYSAYKKTGLQFSKMISVVYTFLILHLSYGTGYLKGILEFILLDKQPSKKSTELTR